ncbi:MAG TPA: DUF433 domain-containing protein [Mycobacteriales bacterium]|nr:DUF433 domain-containing protein [Mycobacteriales bacterium]
MAYSAVLAAALSGGSVRQLAYWRSARSSEGPLLAPKYHEPRARVYYSFRDVLALRTFVYLRGQDVPLQRVRKAVRSLRRIGEIEHISAYQLVAVGRGVAWRASDEEAVDLTEQPGQHVIAEMLDILGSFQGPRGREVVPLLKPKPGVSIDPGVRGGYPVIEGTRVPYDLVSSLLADGMTAAEVASIYPTVDPDIAHGALDFDLYVDGYRPSTAA